MNTASKNRAVATPVILIFGPTAVGKTELLLDLFADRAEIINADSMQIYRGMDIGTAKPGPAVLGRIPHHLIDIRDPDRGYSVGDFVRDADSLVGRIHARGRLSVVSGGTAFYLQGFVYGLPHTPRVDKKTKNELVREGDEVGIEALREELGRVDPEAAHRIPARDRYRIVRALEVYRATGRPLSSFTVPSVPRRKYRFLTIGLQRDRHELYERINRRVDRMMEDDRLADEVERLLSRGYGFDTPGMRAIGYREFAGYRSGEYSLDRTKELIKRNSRRYAKRQITFFRRFPEVRWFFPEDRDAVRALIAGFAPR